jgi:hypothetical protein
MHVAITIVLIFGRTAEVCILYSKYCPHSEVVSRCSCNSNKIPFSFFWGLLVLQVPLVRSQIYGISINLAKSNHEKGEIPSVGVPSLSLPHSSHAHREKVERGIFQKFGQFGIFCEINPVIQASQQSTVVVTVLNAVLIL